MTIRFCDFCGKEIPLHAKVCPYCKQLLTTTRSTENVEEPTKKLDISKYLNNENKTSYQENNYFEDTNIYSFSNEQIEKEFAPKSERLNNENIENEVEPTRDMKAKPLSSRRKPKKKFKKPIIIGAVCGIVVLAVILVIIINPFGSKDTSLDDLNTETQTTTVITTIPTTTVPTTTAPTTTVPTTIAANSVDLNGYLGVKFENVKNDFGTQIKEPQNDDYYGGQTYYFDGLTLSTSSKGGILSVKVDYRSASDKDTYRFEKITFYSTYSDILAEMGEPDLSQLTDPNEPCIGYNLSEGTSQFIKILFDDNKKVYGYDIFYSDN